MLYTASLVAALVAVSVPLVTSSQLVGSIAPPSAAAGQIATYQMVATRAAFSNICGSMILSFCYNNVAISCQGGGKGYVSYCNGSCQGKKHKKAFLQARCCDKGAKSLLMFNMPQVPGAKRARDPSRPHKPRVPVNLPAAPPSTATTIASVADPTAFFAPLCNGENAPASYCVSIANNKKVVVSCQQGASKGYVSFCNGTCENKKPQSQPQTPAHAPNPALAARCCSAGASLVLGVGNPAFPRAFRAA